MIFRPLNPWILDYKDLFSILELKHVHTNALECALHQVTSNQFEIVCIHFTNSITYNLLCICAIIEYIARSKSFFKIFWIFPGFCQSSHIWSLSCMFMLVAIKGTLCTVVYLLKFFLFIEADQVNLLVQVILQCLASLNSNGMRILFH